MCALFLQLAVSFFTTTTMCAVLISQLVAAAARSDVVRRRRRCRGVGDAACGALPPAAAYRDNQKCQNKLQSSVLRRICERLRFPRAWKLPFFFFFSGAALPAASPLSFFHTRQNQHRLALSGVVPSRRVRGEGPDAASPRRGKPTSCPRSPRRARAARAQAPKRHMS